MGDIARTYILVGEKDREQYANIHRINTNCDVLLNGAQGYRVITEHILYIRISGRESEKGS